MASPFLAEIRIFSISYAPQGWALCNGQLLPINQNQALFSLLGTTYGGDGRVNFALPDLRSRVPIHRGADFDLGQRAGSEQHTISHAEMPAHTHGMGVSNNAVTRSGDPRNRIPANSAPNNAYGQATALVSMRNDSVSVVGGSQPHLNIQPYLTLSFCIALQGIFPSRN